MQEPFTTLEDLGVYLRDEQRMRTGWVAFRLMMPMTETQLHMALDQLLPMVQRTSRRIWRERQGFRVRMTLWYRDGVRIADAWRTGDTAHLTVPEQSALDAALRIAQAGETLDGIVGEVVSRVQYENPRHGSRRYGEIVSGITALTQGGANCQGISDAVYLAGTLAGYAMGYQLGRNLYGAHLWNTVALPGGNFALDATHILTHGMPRQVLMDRRACERQGLQWPIGAETLPLCLQIAED